MDRRRFLAIVGSIGLAGCASDDPDPTPSPTPTDTPTPTPTPTQTPTESPTPTDTPIETETETPTPDPNVQQARGMLDQSRDYLNRAVEEYAAQADADEPTILDIGATTEFEPNDVTGWVSNADDEVNSVERTTGGELASEIELHREAIAFIRTGAWLQNRMQICFSALDTASDDLHEQEFADAVAEVESTDNDFDRAEEYLLDVSSNSSPSAMSLLDGVDESDYRSKIDQWKDEVDAIRALRTGFEGLADGIETMNTAMAEYDDGDDRYTPFAPRTMDDAAEELVEAPTPDSLADFLDRHRSLASAFADAASEMDSAAVARENENTRAARNRECDAREAVVDYADYEKFSVGRSISHFRHCD